MSTKTPKNNVKLSVEQLLQLEEFQSRLVNLQTEISIHEKSIRGKKVEITNLEKNREYQQTLNDSLSKVVSDLEIKKSGLEKSVTDSEKRLQDIQFELNKGLTPLDNIAVTRKFASTDYGSMGCSGLVTIVAGDRIWLSTQNQTSTTDITVRHANVNLHRL